MAYSSVLTEPGLTEQYPTHYGSALTTLVIQSQLRNCETGYRQQYVDMLTDLLEGDPHTAGNLRKLFASVANRPWIIESPDIEDESKREAAEEIAAFVRAKISAIPRWQQHVMRLLWAWFYGVSNAEVIWRRDANGIAPTALVQIHSRRIAYDDDFNPYLADVEYQTDGLKFNEYPAKFVLFEPIVTGDYPTREGLGRIAAYWLGFKRFTVRDFVAYCERFGKPFPIAQWSTSDNGTPRPADAAEVAVAKDLVLKIGRGGTPGAALPDSIKLLLANANSNASGSGESTVHKALIQLCNDELSKLVLGGTLTSEVGSTGGNRALGQVQERQQQQMVKVLAAQFDECITTRLVWWIVALNYGEDIARELCPRYCTDVNDPEDQESLALVLEKLTGMGLRVAVAEVRERFGWREPVEGEEVLGGAGDAEPMSEPGEPSDAEPMSEPGEPSDDMNDEAKSDMHGEDDMPADGPEEQE